MGAPHRGTVLTVGAVVVVVRLGVGFAVARRIGVTVGGLVDAVGVLVGDETLVGDGTLVEGGLVVGEVVVACGGVTATVVSVDGRDVFDEPVGTTRLIRARVARPAVTA